MRAFIEALFRQHVSELTRCAEFVALEEGRADRAAYDDFVRRVFETHQNSPHFLAFLLAVAPPGSVQRIQHNLLEELGLEEQGDVSHPAMLLHLLEGAGLSGQVDELRRAARARLDESVQEPLLYGSLREVGLGALVEIVAFEYMLSRVASRIADFLAAHRRLQPRHLVWFRHHSEVDLAHAEEGLDSLVDYVAYYRFDDQEAQDVVTTALRENVFIKRYFGVEALARARGMS